MAKQCVSDKKHYLLCSDKAKWIQEAIKKPNRVRNYLKRKYGDKAFTEDGKIKMSYIRKAIADCRDPSLKRALLLAIKLKKGF